MNMHKNILLPKQGDGKGISGKTEVKAFTFTFTFPNLDDTKKEEAKNEAGSTEG